jgi:hypothetical protein
VAGPHALAGRPRGRSSISGARLPILVQLTLRAMRTSTGQLASFFAAYSYAGSASRSAWRFL